jgi:hypothetical protein
MFQGLFQLIHKMEDREIKVLIDPGTQLAHLKEALVQFLGYVVQFEKEQLASQAEQAKAQVSPVPEVKTEA